MHGSAGAAELLRCMAQRGSSRAATVHGTAGAAELLVLHSSSIESRTTSGPAKPPMAPPVLTNAKARAAADLWPSSAAGQLQEGD